MLPLLLCILFSLVSQINGQSLFLYNPVTATTYLNTVLVSFQVVDFGATPTNIQMHWTYTAGFVGTIGQVFVLTICSNVVQQTFSFNPLYVTTNAAFCAVSPNTAMPDGYWSVYMTYQRSTNNAVVTSSTNVNILTSTVTLPPVVGSPRPNSLVSSPFQVNYTTNTPIALNTAFINFTGITNSSYALVLAMNTTRPNVFNFLTNNITSSSATILSVTPRIAMPDGVYAMIFYYGDTSGHPDAYTAPIVFTLRTVVPPITYNTSSLLFTSLAPFNISIYVPVVPGTNSFTVTLISGTNPITHSYPLYLFANFPFGQSYLLLPYTVADDSNYTLCTTYTDPVSNPPVTSCLYNISIQYALPATPATTSSTDYITIGDYSFTKEAFAGIVIAFLFGGFVVSFLVYIHFCNSSSRSRPTPVYAVVSE